MHPECIRPMIVDSRIRNNQISANSGWTRALSKPATVKFKTGH
jgi:hypothetical protein